MDMDGAGVAYPVTGIVVGVPGHPRELTGVTVMDPDVNTPGMAAETGFAVGLLKVIPPVDDQL